MIAPHSHGTREERAAYARQWRRSHGGHCPSQTLASARANWVARQCAKWMKQHAPAAYREIWKDGRNLYASGPIRKELTLHHDAI